MKTTAQKSNAGVSPAGPHQNLQSLSPRRHAAVMETVRKVLTRARHRQRSGTPIPEVR